MEKEIKTERLLLRPLRASDDAAIAVAANDWDVARRLGTMPFPYGLADAREWIEKHLGADDPVRIVVQDGQFLGVVSAEKQFGYWYGRHAWGKGIATEAGRAYLAEWFSSGGGDLKSGFLDDNIGSKNVLTKLGFSVTGYDRVDTFVAKDLAHTVMFQTRNEWLAHNGLPIETARLRLRVLTVADIPDLQRIAGIDQIARNLGSVTAPWPTSDVKGWIHKSRFRGRVGFRLGIETKDRVLIGSVGLGGEFQPSISYFIDQEYSDQGYASEALQAILSYSFKQFNLTMITADVFIDNPASKRILEKSGFEQCGSEMAQSAARVEPAPVSLYRLTRDRFESGA